MGLVEETKTELKLGHVRRIKCPEAVLEGLQAEKTVSHHLHFNAFGRLLSDFE